MGYTVPGDRNVSRLLIMDLHAPNKSKGSTCILIALLKRMAVGRLGNSFPKAWPILSMKSVSSTKLLNTSKIKAIPNFKVVVAPVSGHCNRRQPHRMQSTPIFHGGHFEQWGDGAQIYEAMMRGGLASSN
jgi:hypothetical protein